MFSLTYLSIGKQLLPLYIGLILSVCCPISTLSAQGIAHRIPRKAYTVTLVNLAEFSAHTEAATLNNLLDKLGFFSQFADRTAVVPKNFFDTAMDATGVVLYYRVHKDSLAYSELIIPVRDTALFKKLWRIKGTPYPAMNGYSRFKTAGGRLFAWNDKELRILTGEVGHTYFYNDSVAARYGIDNSEYAIPVVSAPVADMNSVLKDSTEVSWEATDFGEATQGTTHTEGLSDKAYGTVSDSTSSYADHTDYDSLSTAFEQSNRRNDSIKHVLLHKWLLQEQELLLSGKYDGMDGRQQKALFDKLGLARLWYSRVSDVYAELQPLHSLTDAYLHTSRFSVEDEYHDLFVDAHLKQNKIKLSARISMSPELSQLSKKLYARKPNPKFAKYLTTETAGYLNVNLNTAAYLKEMPTFLSKNLRRHFEPENELLPLLALGFGIVVDEEAVARIMPGDHMVIMNGMINLRLDYIDYEYDDDLNLKEIKKTKAEMVPSFVWMFTSEDQRVIKKTLDFAVSESKASITSGLYQLPRGGGRDFPLYLLFKDNLVMISNDSTQLHKIKHRGAYTAKTNKTFVRLMKSNKLSAAFQIPRLPKMVKDLHIVIDDKWRNTLAELSNYGKFTLYSKGIVSDSLVGELEIELPKTVENGLQFVLSQLLDGIAADTANKVDKHIDEHEND
ncbi:hypothetical protein K7A41_10960 [Sphingobacterium sp. InxBP1]|uniref:hypothetical protein n=1 Tax=Sphingobacterium sp. InxBP1 TaxID=2870328 RepID=UPI002243558D|nr:hypothetical protein [Sphingobacterium sp. InxBP1]MCW8311744.1 hypothetical protein [Sphingobacterium sp. InxBP1]